MVVLIDKFGTEAPMFKGRVVMIPIWNPAPIISNINNHLHGFVIIVCTISVHSGARQPRQSVKYKTQNDVHLNSQDQVFCVN